MDDILSTEELLADLEEISQLKSRPPGASSPTDKGYDTVLKFWTR
jgi:hypothetical protein